MPRDVIKEIANKVMATIRADKVDFDTAFDSVYYAGYRHLDKKTTKSLVGSDLGRRNKGKKRKPKTQPRQAEFFFGVTSAQAKKDAEEHHRNMTAGLPEHDL